MAGEAIPDCYLYKRRTIHIIATPMTPNSPAIALAPPAAIRAAIWVKDADTIVTITVKTDLAAATATGKWLPLTSWDVMTSPMPTPSNPVKKAPVLVVAAPKPPTFGAWYF